MPNENESITISEKVVTPKSYTETVEIRPKFIHIEYPDSVEDDIVASVLYERVVIQSEENGSSTVVSRKPERQVTLKWTEVISLVPSLSNARIEFSNVFSNVFAQYR
jgi:hypothetical protein